MADQELTDEQLVDELKHYGLTVSLPIKWNKRPILQKQLNHFKAKDKPIAAPSKKSASRLSRKKIDAFSSDESDTEDNKSVNRTLPSSSRVLQQRIPNSQHKHLTNDDDDIFKRPNLRSRRSVGSSVSVSPKAQNEVNKLDKLSTVPRAGTSRTKNVVHHTSPKSSSHLGEFSDSELEDGSIYEVVNKSINTSFPYSQLDDLNSPGPSSNSFKRTSHGINTPGNVKLHSNSGFKMDIPNVSVPSKKTANNHVSHRLIPRLLAARQRNYNQSFKTQEEPPKYVPNISKLLVIVLGIFFVLLAISYAYMRRDMFPAFTIGTNESDVTQQTDYVAVLPDSLLPERRLFNESVYQDSVPFLQMVEKELSDRSGKYKCGYLQEENLSIMTRTELEKLSNSVTFSHGKEVLVTATLGLVITSSQWGIRAQTSSGHEAKSAEDVSTLESLSPTMDFFCRIKRAVRRVALQIIAFAIVILISVLIFVGLKFWWKVKEKQKQKVYDMVEKILEIIQTHHENHLDEDPDTQPYVAVQHVRDQLLPPSKRKQLQPIWDKAVEFIEANESRIRLESQVIEGEDFMVWRWIHSLPNGGKVWQGQAFGEYSEAYAATPRYCPFPTLKIRNMFNAEVEEGEDWDLKVKDAILEKTGSNEILHIYVDKNSNEGCVYLKCSSCEEAGKVFKALHGWYFDGRLVTVKFFRLEQYHEKFPYSALANVPLKPTTDQKLSLSRPFYRSSLERT